MKKKKCKCKGKISAKLFKELLDKFLCCDGCSKEERKIAEIVLRKALKESKKILKKEGL